MNNQKLLIYDFNELFEILNEIKNEIDFEILPISDENLKKVNEYDLAIDLVITKKNTKCSQSNYTRKFTYKIYQIY